MSQNQSLNLSDAAEFALQTAREKGATDAEVGVSHGTGLSVSVRQGETETLEHNNDTGLALTVFCGQSKASASSTDLSQAAITETVSRACDIARHTQADPCSGLADKALMATEIPDLDLYYPWEIDADAALELALECEQAGFDYDKRIINSEGASVDRHQGRRVYANTHGFIGEVLSSRHSVGCSLIARDDKGMQRDFWFDMKRDANDLEAMRSIGERAALNTIRRLDAQPIETGHYPVVFAADVATSLFGQLIAGLRGGALYRRSSFLLDKLGEQIFPEFMHIHEQPHLRKALGSAAFDGDGVATRDRDIIRDGVLQGYVLDAYSARRLKMQTTANAGGTHNLTIDHHDLSFDALLKQMDTGVIVTETMGMGSNIVTGDYSQGAAGFWVENGEIQHAIDEFTIAGQLEQMFMDIVAIADDVETRGNTRTGSVLIKEMMVAS